MTVPLFLVLVTGCTDLSRRFDLSAGAARASRPVAATTGHLNVRSGPGMEHRIVAVLPPKTEVELLGEDGIWRRVVVEGRDGRPREGWLSSKYLEPRGVAESFASVREAPREPEVEMPSEPDGAVPLALPEATPSHAAQASRVARAPEDPELPEPSATPPPSDVRVRSPVISSTGYATEIRPLREAFVGRHFADLEANLAILRSGAGDPLSSDPRSQLLRLLEQAVLDIDRGRLERGLEAIEAAREHRVGEDSPPTITEVLEPDERVWLANYEALAHLLRGDARALPLARAAVERQQAEEQALDRELGEREAALQEERERVGERRADLVQEALEQEYADGARQAEGATRSLRSAFPHYLVAVVEEIRSRRDSSRRDAALASYALALRLDPTGDLFRRAVDDLSGEAPAADDRLAHVLVAEGFVPETRVLSADLSVGDRSLDLRLPVRARTPSSVRGVRLKIEGARTEHRLSEIADLEAMALRLERDRAVARATEVLRHLRGAAATGGWLGLFGSTPEPPVAPPFATDPASWMLLPARFHAARLRLPREALVLRIELVGDDDEPLDAVDVRLDDTAHAFVYVRAADGILSTRARSPDWFSETTLAATEGP